MELSIVAGLAVLSGMIVGMLGGGGSVLMVPILIYVLKLSPKETLATSQIVMFFTTCAGLSLHALKQRVVFRIGAIFGGAGMLGAYLGARSAHYISGRILLFAFAALMLISAIEMLRRRPSIAAAEHAAATKNTVHLRMAAVGLGTGFIAGMLGAGGGFIIVPALSILGGLAIERAVGTSLMVIAMQSLAGSIGYLGHVHVQRRLVAILSLAMCFGALGGSLLGQRLPALLLRRLFAGLLLGVATFMLLRNLL